MKTFLITLALLLFVAAPAFATTHYVYCNAAGTASGADFTNAYTDLPTNLTRGDTYVVAGANSTGCTYAAHEFADTESGTTVITVRKAVSATDSGVAGWAAGFATTASTWTITQNSDFQSNSNISPLFEICRSYYTIDGETGTSDPSAGGPSGYGFVLKSANNHFIGLLNISTHDCGAGNGTQLTNISLAHIEINGVNNYSSASIQNGSCNYVSTTVTVTLSPTPSWTLSNNDQVEIDTQIAGGTAVTPSNCCTVTSVSSWPTVSFTAASNPCSGLTSAAVLGNNFGGAAGFYPVGIGTTNTYNNITANTLYIHDTAGSLIVSGGLDNFTIEKSFIARDRYTPLQHANGWDDHVLQSCCVSSNVSVFYNWWEDIVGTAYISIFNAGSGGNQSLATETGWNIYGNVMWQTNPSALTVTGALQCFGTGVQPVACSHFKFLNNTIYNLSSSAAGTAAHVGFFEVDPSAVDVEVYDNIWVASNNVAPQIPAGNTICWDETAACASTAILISDYNFYDTNNTGTAASDVHVQSSSVNPATFFTASSSSNFTLAAHNGAAGLNTHSLLAANDTDFYGTSRCVGSGCPTTSSPTNWDTGAFAFSGGASTPTFSPVAGTYSGTQTVTISSASPGAIICYNTSGSPATNGTTGCTTGTLYSTPVSVSATETLYAVAGGTGYTDSSVGSALYTITATGGKTGVTGGKATGVIIH